MLGVRQPPRINPLLNHFLPIVRCVVPLCFVPAAGLRYPTEPPARCLPLRVVRCRLTLMYPMIRTSRFRSRPTSFSAATWPADDVQCISLFPLKSGTVYCILCTAHWALYTVYGIPCAVYCMFGNSVGHGLRHPTPMSLLPHPPESCFGKVGAGIAPRFSSRRWSASSEAT
jgi:hypothetical protein